MSNSVPKVKIETLPTRPGFIRSIRVTIPPGARTDRTFHREPYVVIVQQHAEVERQIWTKAGVSTTQEVYEPSQPKFRAAGLDHSIFNSGTQPIEMEKHVPPPGGVLLDNVSVLVAELAEPQDLLTAAVDPGKTDADVLFARGLIDAPTLATNVTAFLRSVGEILDAVPNPIGTAWQADEITVSAEVSPMGAVSLVGTGRSHSGGMTFKLKRIPAS